jgi:hypothetical protein
MQPGIPTFIAWRAVMLATVCLYDQPRSKMHKINHIKTNWLLASEFLATQPMRPQAPPQAVFALGQVLSQLLGKFALFHYPSPARGEGH